MLLAALGASGGRQQALLALISGGACSCGSSSTGRGLAAVAAAAAVAAGGRPQWQQQQQQPRAAFHSSPAPPGAADGPSPLLAVCADRDALPAATTSGDRALNGAQLESLAIFRRFNVAQPGLRGQVVLARVLQVAQGQALVDPGYYGLNWVPLSELASASAYDADGAAVPRRGASPQPGDYVKLRLSELHTPYGDAQLDAVGVPADVRQKLVWQELESRMRTGRPVRGRILNPTVKGYAVGVAGYVALLEHGHATPEQARNIGALQSFYVHAMDRARRLIKLSVHKRGGGGGELSMEEMYRQTMPQ